MTTRKSLLSYLPPAKHLCLVNIVSHLCAWSLVESLPGSRYIPPQFRNRSDEDEKDSEQIVKLTRQLKGLLNRCVLVVHLFSRYSDFHRMSEQNMSMILDSIEDVYRK